MRATTNNIAASLSFPGRDRRLPDRRDPRCRGRLGVLPAAATGHQRLALLVGSMRIGTPGPCHRSNEPGRQTGSSWHARPKPPSIDSQSRHRWRHRSPRLTAWNLALRIFGLHLVGLGALLLRLPSPRPPRPSSWLPGPAIYSVGRRGRLRADGQHVHVRGRGPVDLLALLACRQRAHPTPTRSRRPPRPRQLRRDAIRLWSPIRQHPRRFSHERFAARQ